VSTVLIPQRVGVDGWPVVSAIRLGTRVAPAEFAAVVDCGEGGDARFATVRAYVWPDGRVVAREGLYDLTLEQAQQDLLTRVKLLPTHQVEAVVEVREPYHPSLTTVFLDGRPVDDFAQVRVRVVLAYRDSDDWPDDGPLDLPELDGLSPAAARHVRELYAAGAQAASR